MSLFNVDKKIISKALATKLKKTLPRIISSNQTVYINEQCISETGRLISDITEVCNKQNIWRGRGGFSNQGY